MERDEKEVIIFKKHDKYGAEITLPIYMINEAMSRDFKSLVKRKEERQNTRFVRNTLPKDLFEKVENNSLIKDPIERYKQEKESQFKIIKYNFEPYSLKKNLNKLKII